MKEPKIITRLSLHSEEDESVMLDINSIQGNLPKIDQHYKKGEDRLLKTGKLQPFKNKSTLIQFVNMYHSFDLNDVNKNWVDTWNIYLPELQKIKEKYKFKIYLHYEVIGSDYPAFIFSSDFAAFLAKFQIELSMDIYNE